MRTVQHKKALREALAGAGGAALVPTMGNLHEGHFDLVRSARASGMPVVVSIFVNRLQFGPHEDFDRYPRTMESDQRALEKLGVDLVFAPLESELYPRPQHFVVKPARELAGILEGEFRPGFFEGVCTVVLKLLNCVRPAAVYFGKKDYQQMRVIRAMVEQFDLGIRVEAVETRRAPDGLALSSRNAYLSEAERREAPALHAALQGVAERVRGDAGSVESIERDAMESLAARGWKPDYLSVRRRDDLSHPSTAQISAAEDLLVVVAAARLGGTRLVDSLEF